MYCYKTLQSEAGFHETCSRKFFGWPVPPSIPYSLNEMAEMARNVVQERVSVPGIQPKLSLSIVKKARQKSDKRLTVFGASGGDYIFKPPASNFEEMPANEHLSMRLAEAYGIHVVQSSLIRLQSGELSYITKRVDRINKGRKVHMLDMFQITEAIDKYKSSMEKVGKALGKYSANPLLDKLFLFEITLFIFLTGNNDMHLKNFSMIMNNGKWVLAPAYDLLNVAIILPEDSEELALTLDGKKCSLNRSSFEMFGNDLGLNEKQVSGVFSRYVKNMSRAIHLIENSFLSDAMQRKYLALMESRYKRL